MFTFSTNFVLVYLGCLGALKCLVHLLFFWRLGFFFQLCDTSELCLLVDILKCLLDEIKVRNFLFYTMSQLLLYSP